MGGTGIRNSGYSLGLLLVMSREIRLHSIIDVIDFRVIVLHGERRRVAAAAAGNTKLTTTMTMTKRARGKEWLALLTDYFARRRSPSARRCLPEADLTPCSTVDGL